MSEIQGYQKEIDAVKSAIILQKVPTKYAKGLAILSTLAHDYGAGDPLAGIILESAMKSDMELVGILEKEAGLEPGKGVHWTRLKEIWEAYSKDYQVFRALNSLWDMGIIEKLKEVK